MSGRGRGRGRGRGGRGSGRGRRGRSGSRGGSRGRGGFGRGRGRGAHVQRQDRQLKEEDENCKADPPQELDIINDPKAYFKGNVSFSQHYDVQQSSLNRYAATIAVMMKNGVDLSQIARVRMLAAAWARKDNQFAQSLLQIRKYYGFVEVLKAVSLLDSGRCGRFVEKKLKRLQYQKNKVNPRKIGKIKCDMDNFNLQKPEHGSASGSVCKHIRRWVKTLTKDELEFYALHFPVDPWKKLADIVHFNPAKDFSVLPWFLSYCFGSPAPEDSMVKECRDLTKDNVDDLLQKFYIPYTHVRNHVKDVTEESKAKIAYNEPKLDTVLWYYEDLHCNSVDNEIMKRLENGEEVTLANGKLLERLMTIRLLREGVHLSKAEEEQSWFDWDWETHPEGPPEPEAHPEAAPFFDKLMTIAQNRIANIKLPLDSPIVILGDRSGSMEVAIKTSSIIAGILTSMTSAKLFFFNEHNMEVPKIPQNITEVLNLAMETTADGGTSPAASLYPFYEKKEIVKTFVIVTDEEEMDPYEGYSFASLYKKYHDEVYPAKLVFVSFISQTDKGKMVSDLQDLEFSPMQFKFDPNKPDLSKLDHLFALLSTETAGFDEEVKLMEDSINEKGMGKIFQQLID